MDLKILTISLLFLAAKLNIKPYGSWIFREGLLVNRIADGNTWSSSCCTTFWTLLAASEKISWTVLITPAIQVRPMKIQKMIAIRYMLLYDRWTASCSPEYIDKITYYCATEWNNAFQIMNFRGCIQWISLFPLYKYILITITMYSAHNKDKDNSYINTMTATTTTTA